MASPLVGFYRYDPAIAKYLMVRQVVIDEYTQFKHTLFLNLQSKDNQNMGVDNFGALTNNGKLQFCIKYLSFVQNCKENTQSW